MRIVVSGWVAAFPTAGFLWHAISFALGFRELGHEVWFLDDVGDEPWGWDPDAGVMDPACLAGARFLATELEALGLGDRWCLRVGDRHHGMDAAQLADVLAEADVLVNVSLTLPRRAAYLEVPHRLGIDTDPVFTQIRIARGDHALAPVPGDHSRLFTFGVPPLPAQGHDWVPTRQPVALDRWPVTPPPAAGAPFTTLTTWRAYPPQEWDGEVYAAKDVSLRALLDLPSRTHVPLAVALGGGEGHADGAATLGAHGWSFLDPIAASRSTAAYHAFLAASAGEIGVAKAGYVSARSGWFSERTCCYLASGRPAVVQDTGWSQWLPAGEGLLAYSDAAGAAAALEAVADDLPHHAAAARRLAEEHFAAADVCAALLEAAL